MAEKDDEFLDGEEADAGATPKEAGKAKAPFASAMLMQILKWAGIVVAFLILTVTISVVVFNVLGGNSQQNDRAAQSPEYSTKPLDVAWYSVIEEMRGFTNDAEGVKRMYTIKLHLGYEKNDKNFSSTMVDRTIQIQDALLQWFSQQTAEYLGDINNRESIRETIRQQINKLMEKPILDVRFTKYEILSL